MSKLTRRGLLVAAAALVLAGAGGHPAIGGPSILQRQAATIIRKILTRRLPTVTFADADLEAFTADFIALDQTDPLKLAALCPIIAVIYDENARALLPSGMLHTFSEFERRVITAFIQSTDFRMDANPRVVHFHSSADPYVAICANRLFRPTMAT